MIIRDSPILSLNTMRSIAACLILCLSVTSSAAQSISTPVNHEDYHLLDRMEIQQSLDSNVHTALKPFDTQSYLELNETMLIGKPFLKSFYKNGLDFYELKTKDLELRINPVLQFQYGNEQGVNESKFINTRGIEVKGHLDNKITYYVIVTDNQIRFPDDVENRISLLEAVPSEGFYKIFKDSVGVDFLSARASFGVPISRHIRLQFGHDRHFIGNGYRSLLLSENSSPYLFLRLNTNIWRLNYQNLFVELTGQYPRFLPDTLRPKKFAAFHHLSMNLTKNLNIGLFEAIVFSRSSGYELQYLNPIIFYRAVEQAIGSPDNAMIGLDFKYNFLKHFSIYGQGLLDEFNFQQIKDSSGWWGNKFGIQAGIKYIDAGGIPNLDLQVEYNAVRPYTYTHTSAASNYTHYNQAFAHPLGANFKEYIGILRYQLTPKLNIKVTFITATQGLDTIGSNWQDFDSSSTNWGANIFLPYTSREQEYNNKLGQGFEATLMLWTIRFEYQWKRNIILELLYRNRYYTHELVKNSSSSFVGAGLRMNMPTRKIDF